jgi:hypothetical protein
MKTVVRCGVAALVLFSLAPVALADQCAALAGKSQCFTFKYSTGKHNKFTGTYGTDGSFTLNGYTGTYSCAGGQSLLEVDYLYGTQSEQQQWYAVAGLDGDTTAGNGKSITNGYMYTVSSKAGACGGGSESRGSETRQDR